jgi:hypothetical protein
VRFVGSLAFFLVCYVIYFSITQGFTNFIQGLTALQSNVWFIPYIWPGLALYDLLHSVILEGILLVAGTALFMAGLYYLAVLLNQRFGLYEPPAIRVQKTGTVYSPKIGFLGKLGFSSVEAALIRKDIRAFTRRRELIGIFIVPIVFIILPIMNSINITGAGNAPAEVDLIFVVMTFFLPAGIMASSVGNMLIGEEGQAVWRIYASPISPKNLVKSKLFLLYVLSTAALLLTGTVGALFYQTSLKMTATAFITGFFVILAVGAISLSIGFRGADFSLARRARMIRQEWAFISIVVCALAGLAVLAPLIPFAIGKFIAGFMGGGGAPVDPVILAIAIVISGIIASVITVIFYRVNLKSAAELIRKAEV